MLIVLTVLLIASVGVQAQADTIRVLAGTGGLGRATSVAVDRFQEETGIKVDLIQLPSTEVREKQLLELSTGSTSLDVVIADDKVWLVELYRFMEPLEPWIEKSGYDLSQNIEAMVNLFRWIDPTTGNEALYGLPFRIGGRVLIYRKDLIPNPPRTFGELLEIAKAITEEHPGTTYGYVAAMSQHTHMIADWLPFLRGFGGDIMSADLTKVIFNSPEGIAGTQFFVDLYRKYKVVPPGAVTYISDSTILAMQQGLAAMTINFSPYVDEMNDPEKSKFAGNFAIAPFLPYAEGSGLNNGISTISGWGFGISKFSRNKELAWKFVQFMASEETQKYVAINSANAPTAKAVFTDEQYLAKAPFADAILKVFAYGKCRPASLHWAEIEDILAAEISAALAGKKTVEKALADAETRALQIIGN